MIVGLGNPGARYAKNRHNVGFMVVDRLGTGFREGFQGRWTKARLAERDVVLLEPLTYMNLSGESVRAAMDYFDEPLEEVIVVHDELDLPFGTVRLKLGGGAAGHNGLRSIIDGCGDPGFIRLRVGIGRPPEGTIHDWVLGDFDETESAALDDVLRHATRVLETVLTDGIAAAMNQFNTRA